VVCQLIDEGDGAGRVREDGAPLFEGQVCGDHQGLLLVTTADDLKEEIGGVGVVREIAYFVNRE
jgi:hypothetical protein